MNEKLLPFPISINKKKIPNFLRPFVPCVDSPGKILTADQLSRSEFTKCVSTFRVGNTWKTTSSLRHFYSDQKFCELVDIINKPFILDVGVSDGITSLELIEKLNDKFAGYFVTDLYFDMYYSQYQDSVYIYEPITHDCIMKISDKVIVYFQERNILPFINSFIEKVYAKVPAFDSKHFKKASFCQPDLISLSENDKRIIVKNYNVMESWDFQAVDIIKAANVLNPGYFSKSQMKTAVLNLKKALKEDGYLLVVDNREMEKWSLFMKQDDNFVLTENFKGGSDVEFMVISSSPSG
jgi:hypothetical protein